MVHWSYSEFRWNSPSGFNIRRLWDARPKGGKNGVQIRSGAYVREVYCGED